MDNSILFSIVYLILGSLMLYFGADNLVKGSSKLALNLGITPLVIGLTVVAFGTSAPELIVSLSAGMNGNSDIALGNIIGSNICNIALILGLSSIVNPIEVHLKSISLDLWVMIIASIAVIIMAYDGQIGRVDGIILIIGMISYIIFNINKQTSNTDSVENNVKTVKNFTSSKLFYIILIIVGLALLLFGANLFLDGAINIAKYFGLSNSVIGLTIVALGTSLPEIATSVVASIKHQSDISLGNIVGSNIFNILLILGLTSLLFPINTQGFSLIDIGIMIFLAVIIVPLSIKGSRYSRFDGAFLLMIYAGYMYYLLSIN